MIVIRRNPVNRLQKVVKRPGGPTVPEAIDSAHVNLKTLQDDCLAAMDAKLALIAAAVARCRTGPTPEETDTLYGLGNDVLEVAGVFDMLALGKAAFSLCDLMDRSRASGRWSQPALEVHLNGLVALRALAGQDDVVTEQVLEGLRRVAEHVGRAA
jgi:hypothetical protein